MHVYKLRNSIEMVEELKIESSEEALGYRQFISAEPQIKRGSPGSLENPFDSRQSALDECKRQIVATNSIELESDDAVFNFGFVYVNRQIYWIIYIDNRKALNILHYGLQGGYNILTYGEIDEYCNPFGSGYSAGQSPEQKNGQTIWDKLTEKEGFRENPPATEIFGPTFDDEEAYSEEASSEEDKKASSEYNDFEEEKENCPGCAGLGEKIEELKAKIKIKTAKLKQSDNNIVKILLAKIKRSAEIDTEVLKKLKVMQDTINT